MVKVILCDGLVIHGCSRFLVQRTLIVTHRGSGELMANIDENKIKRRRNIRIYVCMYVYTYIVVCS